MLIRSLPSRCCGRSTATKYTRTAKDAPQLNWAQGIPFTKADEEDEEDEENQIKEDDEDDDCGKRQDGDEGRGQDEDGGPQPVLPADGAPLAAIEAPLSLAAARLHAIDSGQLEHVLSIPVAEDKAEKDEERRDEGQGEGEGEGEGLVQRQDGPTQPQPLESPDTQPQPLESPCPLSAAPPAAREETLSILQVVVADDEATYSI